MFSESCLQRPDLLFLQTDWAEEKRRNLGLRKQALLLRAQVGRLYPPAHSQWQRITRGTIAGGLMPVPEQWLSLVSLLYRTPSSFPILFLIHLIKLLVWSLDQNINALIYFLVDQLRDFQKKARWTKLSILSLSLRNPYARDMKIQLSSPCLLREVCILLFKPWKHVLGRTASSIVKTPWQVWIDFIALHTHTHHSPLQRSLFDEKIFQSFLSSNLRDLSFTPTEAATILLKFNWTPKSIPFHASFGDCSMRLPETMGT